MLLTDSEQARRPRTRHRGGFCRKNAIARPLVTASLQCHGLSCLAAMGGRLLHPGDAQAELLKAGGIRRAIASLRVGRPLPPGSIVEARPSASFVRADRGGWLSLAGWPSTGYRYRRSDRRGSGRPDRRLHRSARLTGRRETTPLSRMEQSVEVGGGRLQLVSMKAVRLSSPMSDS